MKFFPLEKQVYHTKLKETEVLQRIEQLTQSSGGSLLVENKYKGSVNANSFNLQRVINYRNSFLPIVFGQVEKDFQGTAVHLKLRMNMAVIIFTLVWCLIVAASFVVLTIKSIKDDELKVFVLALPAMLIIAYIIVVLAFKREAKKAKNDLRALLEIRE